MSQPLSPEAQAVYDAVRRERDGACHVRRLGAAAIRAAVDAVCPPLGRPVENAREDERLCVREELLAIVHELLQDPHA